MIFLYKAGSFIFATSVKSESVKKRAASVVVWPRLQIQAWHSIPPKLSSRSFCCSSIYFVQQDHAFKALLVPNELREFVKVLFT